MAISVGDIVKFKDASSKGEVGRVCKDNGISVCVHFHSTGCLRVSKRDLEPASGKAPDCDEPCRTGC